MRVKILLLALLLVLLTAIGVFQLWTPNPEPSPVPLPPVRAARVDAFEGDVRAKPRGQVAWFQVRAGQWLSNGDMLMTGPRGSAHLVFVDTATLDVRPDSLLAIESASQDRQREALGVQSGGVQYAGPGREVWTPTGRWFPKPGAAPVLVIRVGKDGATEIRQTAGAGTVRTAAGQTVPLQEGTGLDVDATGRTPGLRTLLPAPQLLAPPDHAEVTFVDPTRATTVLLWREVAGAATYHLVLDETGFFLQPRVDRSAIPGTSVEVEGLPVGTYFWTVSAIGPDGKEGQPSASFRFLVRSHRSGSRPASAPSKSRSADP